MKRWLTQIQIAEPFHTTVPNINLHLKAIYAEGEVFAEATIKFHLIVRLEGSRKVSAEQAKQQQQEEPGTDRRRHPPTGFASDQY